jgi:flagellar basal-body rod protein FlgF
LAVSSDGRLVRASDGRAVLDAAGGEIRLRRDEAVSIGGDGVITQGGAVAGSLSVVGVEDERVLNKAGSGDYEIDAPNPGELLRAAAGRVRQGAVEGSGVNLFSSLMGVTGAGRAAQGGLRMVSVFDQLNGLAVTRLGRVS